jgi:hypothetical protein
MLIVLNKSNASLEMIKNSLDNKIPVLLIKVCLYVYFLDSPNLLITFFVVRIFKFVIIGIVALFYHIIFYRKNKWVTTTSKI